MKTEIQSGMRLGTSTCSADSLIAELEARGLGWSLDHTGRLIEARVWDWPNVIGRYQTNTVEPLSKMLAEAMYQVDWLKYPILSNIPDNLPVTNGVKSASNQTHPTRQNNSQ